jgi:hypothetical protein
MMNLANFNMVFIGDVLDISDLINLIYYTSIIIRDEVTKIYNYLDLIVISVTGLYFMAGRQGAQKIFDNIVKGVTLVAGGTAIASQLKPGSSQGKTSNTGSSNTTTKTTTTTTTTTETSTSSSATKK